MLLIFIVLFTYFVDIGQKTIFDIRKKIKRILSSDLTTNGMQDEPEFLLKQHLLMIRRLKHLKPNFSINFKNKTSA